MCSFVLNECDYDYNNTIMFQHSSRLTFLDPLQNWQPTAVSYGNCDAIHRVTLCLFFHFYLFDIHSLFLKPWVMTHIWVVKPLYGCV